MGGRVVAMLAFVLSTAISGCLMPPFDYVLTDDGQSIRLDVISVIVSDANLSEEQKKEELRNLGIDDQDLIDYLVRELGQ